MSEKGFTIGFVPKINTERKYQPAPTRFVKEILREAVNEFDQSRVRLSCGHIISTRAKKKTRCPKCKQEGRT